MVATIAGHGADVGAISDYGIGRFVRFTDPFGNLIELWEPRVDEYRAMVEAEIEANTAIIAGRMVGNVVTSEKIELQAKCEMEGDLKTKSLVIEQGAVFCGACNMKESKGSLGFLPPEQPKKEVEPADKKKIF